MKKKLIYYLEQQILYHENTIASDKDPEIIDNAKKDIQQLEAFINWIKKSKT